MKTALIVLLALHGAIHFIGVAKRYRFRPLWAVVGVAMIGSAAMLAMSMGWWFVLAAAAIFASQALILSAWKDAKAGTLVNLLVLVPVAIAALQLRSSSLTSTYQREVERGLARSPMRSEAEPALVTEADLARHPPLVQQYLRRVGVVGKPRVHAFRAHFTAEMKMSPDADFIDATAEQTSFFDEPARFFIMDATRAGVPFRALHRYVGPHATFEVRVADLVKVVDARGPEMDRSETVTMFNDLCAIAPPALVFADVRWEEMDGHHVRGFFTNRTIAR